MLEVRAELHGAREVEKAQTLAYLQRKIPAVSVSDADGAAAGGRDVPVAGTNRGRGEGMYP
eukprot:3238391-Pyramimonas_sp.AAC.1